MIGSEQSTRLILTSVGGKAMEWRSGTAKSTLVDHTVGLRPLTSGSEIFITNSVESSFARLMLTRVQEANVYHQPHRVKLDQPILQEGIDHLVCETVPDFLLVHYAFDPIDGVYMELTDLSGRRMKKQPRKAGQLQIMTQAGYFPGQYIQITSSEVRRAYGFVDPRDIQQYLFGDLLADICRKNQENRFSLNGHRENGTGPK